MIVYLYTSRCFTYGRASGSDWLAHSPSVSLLRLVVVDFESNCPPAGPGTIGEVPSVGDLLKNPRPYLREFRRKPRKTPKG